MDDYPAEARYGTTYVGLRNRLSVLSEAYSYAPYKTRVLATRDFVRECLETAVKHKAEIIKLLDEARGRAPHEPLSLPPVKPVEQVAIQSKVRAAGEPVTVLGYVETQENGRRKKTDTTKDYTLQLMNEFEPAASGQRVRLPIWCRLHSRKRSRRSSGMASKSRSCGRIIELDVEVYRLDKVERSPRRFEGHQPVELATTSRRESRMIKAGKSRGAHGPAAGGPCRLSSRAGLRGRAGHVEFLR